MIPLDLNGTIFNGSSGSTPLFQNPGQGLQLDSGQGDTGDDGHPLAFATFALAGHSHSAIIFWC